MPPHLLSRRTAAPMPTRLVAWALVLAASELAFFVHVLHDEVRRGEALRQAQQVALPGQSFVSAARTRTSTDVEAAAAPTATAYTLQVPVWAPSGLR